MNETKVFNEGDLVRFEILRDWRFTDMILVAKESLVEWRRKWDSAISPLLLRISIGLEDFEHLRADLEQLKLHLKFAALRIPNCSRDVG